MESIVVLPSILFKIAGMCVTAQKSDVVYCLGVIGIFIITAVALVAGILYNTLRKIMPRPKLPLRDDHDKYK